jgi:hypothetical protein
MAEMVRDSAPTSIEKPLAYEPGVASRHCVSQFRRGRIAECNQSLKTKQVRKYMNNDWYVHNGLFPASLELSRY